MSRSLVEEAGKTESRDEVPDPLERQRIMVSAPRGIPDDARVEIPVPRQRRSECYELLTAVLRMLCQLVDPEAETLVPFDSAPELVCLSLDVGATEARVQDKCLDVSGQFNWAMNLRFDIVVEQILTIGQSKLQQ